MADYSGLAGLGLLGAAIVYGNRIKMIYPERRYVSPETIIRWANDLMIDNGDELSNDLEYCMEYLEDQGAATFVRR